MEEFLPLFHSIPQWFKILYTAFAILLIPVYFKHYGITNFLWFSDIALFTLALALWIESSLLASMMALGVLLPEIAWNIDFFGRLITGKKLIGLTDYMFEKEKPFFVRALSLFHVVIPPLLIWMLILFGYEKSAIYWQTILAWIILPACYVFTPVNENINWVFGPGSKPQQKIVPFLYFLLMMLSFPIVVFLPTHLLLNWIFN
ncbi:MAG: membrane-associated protein [Bacteroidota bacterium]|nr:membrane-associated protein [Bacteroidota bacterium]